MQHKNNPLLSGFCGVQVQLRVVANLGAPSTANASKHSRPFFYQPSLVLVLEAENLFGPFSSYGRVHAARIFHGIWSHRRSMFRSSCQLGEAGYPTNLKSFQKTDTWGFGVQGNTVLIDLIDQQRAQYWSLFASLPISSGPKYWMDGNSRSSQIRITNVRLKFVHTVLKFLC
jgi:hypothetical protein